MRNKINENNYSLAWITSTITEAEERLSGLQYKIVQINTVGQNKEKRKERTTVSATVGTTLNAPTFELYGSQKKKRYRKDVRKYLKRL